jgi:hypothetical protein
MAEQNPYQPPQAAIDRPAEPTSMPLAVGWIVTFAAGGFLIGLASRTVRPYISGPVHYEMLVALGLLIGLALAAIYRFRKLPLRTALRCFNLAMFSLWAAFAIGWTVIHRGFWDDLVGMTAAFWIGSAVIGSILLKLLHVYKQHQRPLA